MRSALVLAGGRSTRFGDAETAVAELDGTPLVRRVADRLSEVADDLVVNCRESQVEAVDEALAGLESRLAVDPVPDRGPIAGMRTGLRIARGDAVAVAACDMPDVDPALFERLFDAAEGAAVPASGDRLHPLHAVYDARAARTACDRTLATGSRRLHDVLARLDPVVVDLDGVGDVDARPFEDATARGPADRRDGQRHLTGQRIEIVEKSPDWS